VAGIADIVESELAVGDIIIATSIEIGNGSTNVAPVRWNIRGEHLDPLTIGSIGVLQESADLSGRASDLLSIVVPGIVGDLRNVGHELPS